MGPILCFFFFGKFSKKLDRKEAKYKIVVRNLNKTCECSRFSNVWWVGYQCVSVGYVGKKNIKWAMILFPIDALTFCY